MTTYKIKRLPNSPWRIDQGLGKILFPFRPAALAYWSNQPSRLPKWHIPRKLRLLMRPIIIDLSKHSHSLVRWRHSNKHSVHPSAGKQAEVLARALSSWSFSLPILLKLSTELSRWLKSDLLLLLQLIVLTVRSLQLQLIMRMRPIDLSPIVNFLHAVLSVL